MHDGPDKCYVHLYTPIEVLSAVYGHKCYNTRPLQLKIACLQDKESLPSMQDAKEGIPFKAHRAYLQGRYRLPSRQIQANFQGSEGLPAMQREPASMTEKDYLQCRRPVFNAERAYLQGREGLVFGMASTSSQNLHLSCSVLQLSLQSCQGKLVFLLCPVLPLLAVLNLSSQGLDL